MICDILMALTVKSAVTALWDVVSCSSVDWYKHLKEHAASAFMEEDTAKWRTMVCVGRE